MIKSPRTKAICLVFEPAYDTHIPKDVIQVPLELAKLLGGCPVYLVTRPNICQEKLSLYLQVIHVGAPVAKNDEALLNHREENIICSHLWQEKACQEAAKYADILMLFPHYGNYQKCAIFFWFNNLLRGHFSKVYLKLDATPDQFDSQDLIPGFKGRLNSLKTWLKYLPITAISVEHDKVFKGFVRLYPELKNKCFIVRNCSPQSEIQELTCKTDLTTDSRRNYFLTIGRLGSYQKATDVLLSAWMLAVHHCPGWKLQLVGACEKNFHQEWLQKLKDAGADETVEWLGVIQDRKAIWNLYRMAKIFTLSSRFEGAALVLVEAIRAGCAVIATPVGEVPSLFSHSDPGLVPIDDPEALAKVMILLASNEELCNKQRRSLQDKILDRTWSIQLKPIAEKLKYSLFS